MSPDISSAALLETIPAGTKPRTSHHRSHWRRNKLQSTIYLGRMSEQQSATDADKNKTKTKQNMLLLFSKTVLEKPRTVSRANMGKPSVCVELILQEEEEEERGFLEHVPLSSTREV